MNSLSAADQLLNPEEHLRCLGTQRRTYHEPNLLNDFILVFYFVEVVKSNARVAHDVLTPTHRMKPASSRSTPKGCRTGNR